MAADKVVIALNIAKDSSLNELRLKYGNNPKLKLTMKIRNVVLHYEIRHLGAVFSLNLQIHLLPYSFY